MSTAARKPPTPQQVQAEQERVRAADEARAKAPNLPSVVETKLPASSDGRSFHDAYLDAIAPASIAGKMLKFSKDGEYQVVEDESTIGEDVQFIALVPETKSRIVYEELPQDDPKRRKPDITRAKALLGGWEPVVDRAEGLKRSLEYFRAVV